MVCWRLWEKCFLRPNTSGVPSIFYRNVFSVTPRSKVKLVAKMLKAIHAQESKKAAREKAKAVVEELRSMKLKEAARKVEDGIEETLTYCDFPSEHWTRIRTVMSLRGWNREIAAACVWLVLSRMVTPPPSCWSVPACAMWPAPSGATKYMNMKHLEAAVEDASIAG